MLQPEPIKEKAVNRAAFLPECVRFALKEMKSDERTTHKPFSVPFSTVFMACEIQAIHESIDLYYISDDFSVVDVMDELNVFVSGIMKRLFVEGGDIMCIENGVIECIWPYEDGDASSLHRTMVLNKALAIQKQQGATSTKVGSQLQNKIVIALGSVELLFVGSDKAHYVLAGDVLSKAKSSLSLCGSGEVVVTKEFWNGIHSKDKYHWKEISDTLVTVYSTTATLPRADDFIEEEKSDNIESCDTSDMAYEISKFLHPLCKTAKTEQQLTILASLSNVVCISVRTLNFDLKNLDLLHKAVNDINKVVTEHKGIVTNIIHQKDPIICIVFGLPGFKRSNNAVEGILCAQNILKATKSLGIEVLIGISGGVVFSGVLGSSLRQQFCVLGMPSHTSLGLVHPFEEDVEVVCDVNIYFRSCRFLGDIFSPIKSNVKGKKYPGGPLFEVHSVQHTRSSLSAKCIGKSKEKKVISRSLKELLENISLNVPEDSLSLISITGKFGSGKTTLLNWSMEEGKRLGYRLTARVENSVFEKSSDNAWSVVKQILASCLITSETKILETLAWDSERFPLHLLNKYMNTSFSQPDATSEKERNGMEMMVELVKQCARGEPVLIGVDNAEHMGTESWLFLQCLLVDRIAVVVATFTEEFSSSVPFVRDLIAHQYEGVKLSSVTGNELGELACHVLRVVAIHKGFLKFLQVQSEGNALHLQEILMLPRMQKHYLIVPFSKVPEEILKQDYVSIECHTGDIDPSTAKVCDIVDPEGLWSIRVPKQIIDLIMDHANAFNPEEQMLMKKCSLLGDTFGRRILEIVCPEYTSDEMYRKVQILMEKNILIPYCEHWTDRKPGSQIRISASDDAPFEYCIHPMSFASRFQKRCVLQSMAENQRERLDFYLADLLQDETNRNCDACRRKADTKRSSHELLRQYKLPNIDFRLCQCLHLRTDILLQVEHHLDKANSPLSKRLDLLLDAAETGLDAGNISKVEDIIDKINQLMHIQEEQNGDDYVHVAVQRLRARVKMQLGNRNDALRSLMHGLYRMDIVFPQDVKSRIFKSRVFKGRLGIEFYRCLTLGCFIQMTLAFYDDAARVGYFLLKCLRSIWLENGQEQCRQLIEVQVLLLKAVSKTEPAKSRERTCYKLINQMRTQCFKRLMENPVLEIEELRTIIRACNSMVLYLFETAELEASKELGRKTVQLLKILNHPKQLVKVLFWLASIFLYEENYSKCAETLEEMQDAYQQSADPASEVLYYIMLTKLLRKHNTFDDYKYLIELCSVYATQGIDRIPQHPKHLNRTYCLCSTMALWCLEEELPDSFSMWSHSAQRVKNSIYLNNYWSISGAIDLEVAKILKMREKCFVFTEKEVALFKQTVIKSAEIIRKQAKKYVPVLERDVRVIEEHLQDAVKECKAFRA